MSDTTSDLDLPTVAGGARKKRGRGGMLAVLLLAVLAGAGGFYATWSGKLRLPWPDAATSKAAAIAGVEDLRFLPIEPMVITLAPGGAGRHLRFSAQIETTAAYNDEVSRIMPRLLDVIHSYMRAVDPKAFDQPGALTKLRAQILRRVQIVTGEDRVRDLLITEFVVN